MGDLKRTGTINLFDTHLGLWEEIPAQERNFGVFWPPMMGVFKALRGVLYQRDWKLWQDPKTSPLIRCGHWLGRKGDLEMVLECSGRSITVEFFQNVANVENSNGGRYDFNKFSKMPRTMRLLCVVEMFHLVRWALDAGYIVPTTSHDHTMPRLALNEPLLLSVGRAMENRMARVDGETPLQQFNRQWGDRRFSRDETGWPVQSDSNAYVYRDADKQQMKPGDVRYFYQRHKPRRLMRGRVYPSMNGMWTIHLADGSVFGNENAGQFFSTEHPDLIPRRLVDSAEDHTKRLRIELDKATKAKAWKRVQSLARVLERTSEQNT